MKVVPRQEIGELLEKMWWHAQVISQTAWVLQYLPKISEILRIPKPK